MTEAQKKTLRQLLATYRNPTIECRFHHGDCIGADEQSGEIANDVGWKVFIHPPDKEDKRAHALGHYYYEPKPYLQRNDDIVKVSRIFFGTPKDCVAPSNLRGEGTWSTILKAKKYKRNGYVIYPDGSFLRLVDLPERKK